MVKMRLHPAVNAAIRARHERTGNAFRPDQVTAFLNLWLQYTKNEYKFTSYLLCRFGTSAAKQHTKNEIVIG